jgi:hypothetical protein
MKKGNFEVRRKTNLHRVHRKLDQIVLANFGVSYNDLPDLVFISDYTFDGMTEVDVHEAAMEIIEELKNEGELPDVPMRGE